jgi:peptidoglycan DL-endopeptidase CwlO
VRYCHDTRWTRALPRLAAALSALATVAALAVAPAAARPGPHKPPADRSLSQRIRNVNAALDRLSRRNDQLDEQYNQAVAAVAAARQSAGAAQQAARSAQLSFETAHAQFVQAVLQQYESGPTASVGTLLTSAAPQQYLDSLTMNNYLSSHFAGTVRADRTLRTAATQAASTATAALAAARAKEADLATRRAAMQAQTQRFTQLLHSLTAEQRRERARALAAAAARARAELATPPSPSGSAGVRSVPRGVPPAVSGDVQRVIAFAEAQVGKSYSYGASGPYSYDCSGLTMASWAQVGVQLPHSAAEQYNYGTHVSYSELQPGDLIFLYSPIGHVELYVGHDLAVSAADPASGIVYVHPSQDMGDYVGATRLTG